MSWTSDIGDFPKLLSTSIDTYLGRWMTFWVTKIKDDYAEESNVEDYLIEYETLEQAMNPRKKKDEDKYTWHGTAKITKKDSDGKPIKDGKKVVYEEVEGDHPVKKFVSVGGPVKRAMVFMLNRFFYEAQKLYTESGSFTSDDKDVLQTLYQHSMDSEEPKVAAFIIKVAEQTQQMTAILNDDEFSSDNFKAGELNKKISDNCSDYFRKGNKTPQADINVLVETFVSFLKAFSILSANSLYEKRQAFGLPLFMTQMRNLYSFINVEELVFTAELSEKIPQFIKSCEDAKKAEAAQRKKEKEETATEDNSGEDDEKSAKKTTKKPKSTKSTKSTKSKKPVKEETPEPSEEDEDEDDFDDVDSDA